MTQPRVEPSAIAVPSLRVRTKIVATLGPATSEESTIEKLVRAGVDVFRINMAHGEKAFHDLMVERIRTVSDRFNQPLGILIDLAGPKIRLGELHQGQVNCTTGGQLRFVRGVATDDPQCLVSNYEPLIDELSLGDMVMLADGAVALQVQKKEKDSCTCHVLCGGEIRSRQGINLPGAALSAPALTEDDVVDAKWAAQREIDFVSISFVREASEIEQLKTLLRAHGSQASVVAKVEKREALHNLESIVAAADVVMVARGDLGVEIDVAETPVAQKRIILTCQRYMKPVIVATQMLDSMQRASRPTRAEVSDVANAILDGADACMLSGETAIGKYPLEAVTMMNQVMTATERMLESTPCAPMQVAEFSGVHAITAAVVEGAAVIAEQLDARLMVIVTRTGGTARVKAKHREFTPTLGVSDSEATLRRMCLYWGIIPLRGAPVKDGPALRRFVEEWGKANHLVQSGDRLVFITGTDFIPVSHNVVVVYEAGTAY